MERMLDEVLADLKAKESELKELYSERNKLVSENITGHMNEGDYYVANITQSEFIYFKYSKDNFQVLDGSGTCGYDGDSYIKIGKCMYNIRRGCSAGYGVYIDYTFAAGKLTNTFSPIVINKITEEEFDSRCELLADFVKDIKN